MYRITYQAEDPQTPPVPQDEDEREPMFVQAHDPDYVPEPIYPEYIPLEDEHEFPAEEQPLPLVDSPTAESPGYVTESDPEEDPEEYEDDETEDGPVDYPMDGGDDDDGDSSRDDADGKDEDDDDDDEEEEHLAPADSAIVVPVDEPVFPPEGTKPVISPPSTDITIRARITVRPHTSISLPPKAEVERLLAMTTPSPSPPISLSPPSAGERLARCTAPPAHSSPATLCQVPNLTYPDMRLGKFTARPYQKIEDRYGFVSSVDVKEEATGGLEMLGTALVYKVTKLAELHEHDTQDLYTLLEDAQDGFVGPVAYRLKLPQELSCVHDTFHVSNLKKCLAEPDVQVPLDEIEIDENLRFVEEPIEIVERDVKKLKRRRIPLVKVRWNSRQGAEYTWEHEDQFRKKYPHLFSETVPPSGVAT
ncbi:hypothetical protein Tco_0254887 [Tanacetum coccineum]